MKKSDLPKIGKMLSIQLHQEEQDYDEVLADKRTSTEVNEVLQRINSLKKLLASIGEGGKFDIK